MKGKEMTTNTTENPWNEESKEPAVSTTPAKKPVAPKAVSNADYDIDGLMTDFPTAKELERFVFDETGIVLNLKGRANKLKYQTAMDALNGVEIDPKFTGENNPYIDKAELIPEEPLKEVPARDASLPDRKHIQNTFYSPVVPHPDDEARAMDKKCHMLFRKYNNGMISYEILGPLEQKPKGEKIDKFGRTRPEIITWVDPRTGEQVIIREDGTLTPQGKRLRGMMQTFKVNKSNQWEVWIDREFISLDNSVANNPWDLSK
jgi:hypothetical protein